jgi:Na+-translocating ferredoxin:NAD+ oxidoreductase RNF subunit RnfB
VDPATGELVEQAEAIFVVDDNACTRCSVCVERCPSDCLYYARLPEGSAVEGAQRPMATVPLSQRAEEPA